MSVQELLARTLGGNTAELRYIIDGESSAGDALAAMLAASPTVYNGIPRSTASATVSETEEDSVYEGRVPYGGGGSTRLSLGESRITIDISSTQTNITHSLNTEHRYTVTGTATDRKNAIGESPDGTVSGTSILTPVVNFTINKVVASSSVTTSFISGILGVRVSAPVNSTTFSHTDTDGRSVSLNGGEGLFLGMTSAALGDGNDELTFSFAASDNLTGVSVGDISGIAKDGWEHLWVYYRPGEDTTAKTTPLRPAEAYVEKVYETGSWAALGL